MVKRNPCISNLTSGYLFPEINRRKKALLERHPEAKLISLGVGDTTEPISPHITECLEKGAAALGTLPGYTGYGPEQGYPALREKIAEVLYHRSVKADEIFISDGSKCDIGRLQLLFGKDVSVAVQDPSYPVYVDSAVIMGQASSFDPAHSHYRGITYLKCTPDNHFFPDLSHTPRTDLIYFCSPNNPTGAVATKDQLSALVHFAKRNRSILIFDAAYAIYIRDQGIPRSIYEIEGARAVAIELGSFSKMAGFTGVRLGWSVVPEELHYDDGSSVRKDWSRIVSTLFNGASNIAQLGGIAALDEQGIREMHQTVNFYLENARLIKDTWEKLGYKTYGGTDTPYIWVHFPNRKSWDVFEEILENAHVVCTPGSGFGPAGEGFLRFSAFGHRHHIEEACSRLTKFFVPEEQI